MFAVKFAFLTNHPLSCGLLFLWVDFFCDVCLCVVFGETLPPKWEYRHWDASRPCLKINHCNQRVKSFFGGVVSVSFSSLFFDDSENCETVECRLKHAVQCPGFSKFFATDVFNVLKWAQSQEAKIVSTNLNNVDVISATPLIKNLKSFEFKCFDPCNPQLHPWRDGVNDIEENTIYLPLWGFSTAQYVASLEFIS